MELEWRGGAVLNDRENVLFMFHSFIQFNVNTIKKPIDRSRPEWHTSLIPPPPNSSHPNSPRSAFIGNPTYAKIW